MPRTSQPVETSVCALTLQVHWNTVRRTLRGLEFPEPAVSHYPHTRRLRPTRKTANRGAWTIRTITAKVVHPTKEIANEKSNYPSLRY